MGGRTWWRAVIASTRTGTKRRTMATMSFKGQHEHSLDDKGRVIVPKSYREAFADGMFLTQGLEGCLWLFPSARWEAITDRLADTDLTATGPRLLERLIYPGLDLTLDRQGRIAIPPTLRDFAGLAPSQPVMLLGVKDRIELWQPELWRAHSREILTQLKDAFVTTGPLGL